MSKKHILITRPVIDAAPIAQEVENLGLKPFIEPLLLIETLPAVLPDLSSYDALIATSANAMRAFSDLSDDRSFPIYTVGTNTADTALEIGFKTVVSADGGVSELLELIEKQEPQKFLYLRGQHLTQSLTERLESAGHKVDDIVLYDTLKSENLSAALMTHLQDKTIDSALFFSKRTADNFVELIRKYSLEDSIKAIKALCLSESVVKSLSVLPWQSLYVCERPNRKGMTALLSDVLQVRGKQERKKEPSMSVTNGNAIDNAEEIIQRFGGIRPMAHKMDVPVTTVQGWKKRNVIPGTRREEIVQAADKNNIDISDLLKSGAIANENTPEQEADSIQSIQAKIEALDKKDVPLRAEKPKAKSKPVQKQRASSSTKSDPEFASHEQLMGEIQASERKAVRSSIWTTVGILIVLVGGLAFVLWPSAQQIKEMPDQISALEASVDGIEGEVGAIKEDVRDLNMRSDFLKGVIPGDMQEKYDQLQNQAGNLQTSFDQLKTQAQETSKAVLGQDAGTFSDRLAAIETQLSKIEGAENLTALVDRIQNLEGSVPGQTQFQRSIAELRGIVDGLSGRVDTLDQKLSSVQSGETPLGQTLTGVNSKDLKAAAMLIAFAQLRDSLNREQGFEQDLALLQKLIGAQDPELQVALARLAPHANQGVLTPEGLSGELRGLTGDIVAASLQGEDVSFTEKAKARMNKLFKIEKDGDLVTGTDTEATVARAQALLDAGDIRGAIGELERLEGPAAQTAKPIIDEAQVTLMARQVQNMLRNSIVSNISTSITASSGPVNLNAPESAATPLQTLIPGQQVIRDEESGTVILPGTQRFKGFSTGQQ